MNLSFDNGSSRGILDPELTELQIFGEGGKALGPGYIYHFDLGSIRQAVVWIKLCVGLIEIEGGRFLFLTGLLLCFLLLDDDQCTTEMD